VDAQPAERQWWPLVESVPVRKRERAEQVVADLKAKKLAARIVEVGSLFAVGGAVLDRRNALVVVEPPLSSEVEGQKRAAALAKLIGGTVMLHPELSRLPAGTVEATAEVGHRLVVRKRGAIWFAPARTGESVHVDDIFVSQGGSTQSRRTESRHYFGRIIVAIDPDGLLTVVNEVPEDKLLAGLVPAEVSASFPDAVLRAQAVAARGVLLAKIGTRHGLAPYLLCASQHCQVYAGAGREDPRTTAAVEATRGEVLLRPDGDLVDPVYSASCGGVSEGNDPIWGGQPDPQLRPRLDQRTQGPLPGRSEEALRSFLQSRPAAFCATASGDPRFRWQVAHSPAEWGRVTAASGYRLGDITAIDVRERGPSGRAIAIRLTGNGQSERPSVDIRGELTIRRVLGGLRSSLFVVNTDEEGGLRITGGGFGHGVGMCQLGALGRAKAGQTYQQILSHYYPGSVLQRLY
jgi:SpoIID/LytB domain protein